MPQKYKIPYVHAIDTYRKASDIFLKGDKNPFEWWTYKFIKGNPEPLENPNPVRKRFYFKYKRIVERLEVWFPVLEENVSHENGRNLVMKSMGLTELHDSDQQEFRDLLKNLKRLKINDYEI